MSVRVNLLPQASRANVRARRQRVTAGVLALVLLLGLAGVYWWQTGNLRDAEDRLAQEQLVTQGLQNEVAALAEYRELADAEDEMRETLRSTFADEVTLAGALQDLALRIPEDAQVDTLSIEFTQPVPDDDDPEVRTPPAGTFAITGQSLAAQAGVERLLRGLDGVATFYDISLNSSVIQDREDIDDLEDVVDYVVDGFISRQVITDRYRDGLPEELR